MIGESVSRVDALAKVTGEALFPGDIDMPDQAHMKILFAGRPHAIIHSLDTSAAEAFSGVLGVFTAKDIPINEYGLILDDQPVLCGPGSNKPHADRVRFIGDQVAVVVADSEEIAAQAAGLIEIEFEDLPITTDPEQAMQPGAFLIHPERESNIFQQNRIRRGDVEAGFAESAVVIESEYRTPAQEHAYLQPEAGLSYIDDEGRVTVVVAGQWTHEDQEQIAHALDLPLEKVRVKYAAVGGAFGGREDMSIQIVLALAALRLNGRGIDRPVKTIWSRKESIAGHHKRHPFILRSKWGASAEGKLLAAEVEVIQDGGAYACTSTKVLGNATLMATGPYVIPNVKVDAYSVYTNHIPGGAFRGFGGPQAAFEAEMQIEKIAAALNLDPVEVRARNVLKDGDLLSVGSPLPEGVTLDRVIERCADEAGWARAEGGWIAPNLSQPKQKHLRRGIGMACSYKNVGFSFGFPEQCWATVELHGQADIEELVLRHAGAEVGQGAHTALVQMAAEAADVPLDKVRIDPSDTATSENSGSASASRMTFMAGHAIRGAVEAAMVKWQDEDRPAIAKYQYRPPLTTPFDSETGQSDPNFAYGYVAEAATVEVDTETGAVRIINVVCADDVGRVINPQGVRGQIEGAVVQATGYAILENFLQEGGEVQTGLMSTYLIPGILDIPEQVESVILEYGDPGGPWGVRGMAEMPFLPLTPAVTAAIHNALGVWFDEFPLTPERVLWGIQASTSD